MCRVTFTLLLLAASVSAAAAAPTSGQPDTNLIDKVIVYIECKSPDGTKTSEGTGVLVSSDGAVLTAKHVVPEGYACLGGIGTAATTPTRKLIPDPRQAPVDAMLLRFVRTGDEVFPFVRYRKIKPSLRGKPIIAYGFPVGQVGDVYQSEGTIAQTNIDARGIFGTTTLESHGMSGGPVVLKEDGNLIGIVVGADFDPTTGAPSSYGVLAAQMVANVFNLTAAEPPSPPGKKLGATAIKPLYGPTPTDPDAAYRVRVAWVNLKRCEAAICDVRVRLRAWDSDTGEVLVNSFAVVPSWKEPKVETLTPEERRRGIAPVSMRYPDLEHGEITFLGKDKVAVQMGCDDNQGNAVFGQSRELDAHDLHSIFSVYADCGWVGLELGLSVERGGPMKAPQFPKG